MLCFSLFLTFSFGELFFAPGDSELEIAVNIVDDDIPEEQEYFQVSLKNPKGGAEIGFGGQVTVIVPTNDDAHGVIGFAQVSRENTFILESSCYFMLSSLLQVCVPNKKVSEIYHKVYRTEALLLSVIQGFCIQMGGWVGYNTYF